MHKWKAYEAAAEGNNKTSADELSDLYIQVTDDLAFARAYYPASQTTRYLNQLAVNTHSSIYKNKKERKGTLVLFYKTHLPLIIRKYHSLLLFSFVFFTLCAVLGALSAHYEHEFARAILSDSYVNMTLRNIENDDPMAVYKGMDPLLMFLYIAINNIWVSFTTYAYGLLFSVGSLYILLKNGFMVGTFQYFFIQRELFVDSALTIWMHGAIEISAIIIAGCAGLILGNSFLFPGTYSRLNSFTRGAKDSVKIIFGLVPFFIVAALIEGFFTRMTFLHWTIRLSVILLSFAFMIWYFVIYPLTIEKNLKNEKSRTLSAS